MLRGRDRRSDRDAPEGDQAAADGSYPDDESAPNTLGRRLRASRLESGFTLEQAAEETRINYGYLDAIEADRFDVLPAPVYVRGFVRLYARFLGIDPEEAIEQLPADLPAPPGLEPLPGLRLREGVGVLPRVGRRWLLLLLVAAIALVAAFMFGVPQLDFIGSEDEPDGAAISGTATPTAEATGTPAARLMPDLIGLEREEAEQMLRDLAVTPVVIEVESSEAPPGQVFTQVPAAGEVLAADQSVTLIVAKQPAASEEEE